MERVEKREAKHRKFRTTRKKDMQGANKEEKKFLFSMLDKKKTMMKIHRCTKSVTITQRKRR